MAHFSSPLNIGRRSRRTAEKLHIFEEKLLKRSKSHLDPVNEIRIKENEYFRKRFEHCVHRKSSNSDEELKLCTKINKSVDKLKELEQPKAEGFKDKKEDEIQGNSK